MTKSNFKISVIVPVYNMAEHLEKSVNTLISQTYKNYEIILIDDGSTDGSSVLCDTLSEQHSTIQVFHKPNGGLSSARNKGIDIATGDFIIFPDPDDWVDENYLSSLIELHNDTQLEICGHYIVTPDTCIPHNSQATKTQLTKEFAIINLLKSTAYCGFAWNKMYHLDIIKAHNLRFDEELGMAQDLHFAFRYILLCDKIAYDPEPHYYYYQHEKGVTNINHPLTARKISGLKTYEKLLELSQENVPEAIPYVCSTIANLNLNFVYIYKNSGMDDKALLNQLVTSFKKHKKYFFKNKDYSAFHKVLGAFALISPDLYFKLRKIKLG